MVKGGGWGWSGVGLYKQYTEYQIRCVKLTSIDANSVISWLNPMFDWDDSNKWSNIGFGQEIDILEIKIRTLSGALVPDIK